MTPQTQINPLQIARVCHETNRAFCASIGDSSQKPWEECEEWQRNSAIAGVAFRLKNPDAPASAQHEAWLKDKQAAGWIYGVEKNTSLRTHPCMVPYAELPADQRMKDHLFQAVVDAFVKADA